MPSHLIHMKIDFPGFLMTPVWASLGKCGRSDSC